jgi:hypothetical protein
MKYSYRFFVSEPGPGKLWRGALLVCSILFIISACKKDLVSADAGNSKEFLLELPSGTTTIIKGIEGGDSIKAIIRIPGEPAGFDTADYHFVWTNLNTHDTISHRYYLTYGDFENQDPASIPCLLTVTEKRTGKSKLANTSVFLTTATREGWVLLGDKSGTAKLSVLTYTDNGYKKFIDIESELGIHLPITGKPVSLNNIGADMPWGLSPYQWMGLTTDKEIKFFRSMDFLVNEDVTDYLNQTMVPTATSPVVLNVAGGSSFTGTQDNKVYRFVTFYMSYLGIYGHEMFSTSPPLQPGAPAFKASPVHTFTGPGWLPTEFNRIMYDMENYEFVRGHAQGNSDVNGVFPLNLPFSKNGFLPKAMHTKIEGMVDEDLITAFLYNPVTEEGYVIEFLSNAILRSVKKMNSADAKEVAGSPFIEINTSTNYLVYTKGNEVKAYDYKMGQAINLLTFTNETISLIKMQRYTPGLVRTPGRQAVYNELFKRLVVCTYNPASPDNSGIFRQYELPLGHQMPVKEAEETGFPKIVDVTFNPMP